jgi:hypothetical protein
LCIGLVDELQERFSDRINDLEAVVREIAIDITTGTLMERLQPKRIWERAGERVTLVAELLKELREYLSIMKPERVPTIQKNVSAISQRLTLFKETLEMDSLDPLDSSRKALEELRQALVEISDFLSLCKEVKETPSPVISSVLSLKGSRVYEVPFETWAKIDHLAEMIKSTQAIYEDIAELTARMENQLDAIRSEYETLMFSFRRKEEKES